MSNEIKMHTKAWYLVPLFFGILGGIVMYIGLKDDDPKMAKKGLILSIVLTVVAALAYIPLILLGGMM